MVISPSLCSIVTVTTIIFVRWKYLCHSQIFLTHASATDISLNILPNWVDSAAFQIGEMKRASSASRVVEVMVLMNVIL